MLPMTPRPERVDAGILGRPLAPTFRGGEKKPRILRWRLGQEGKCGLRRNRGYAHELSLSAVGAGQPLDAGDAAQEIGGRLDRRRMRLRQGQGGAGRRQAKLQIGRASCRERVLRLV